MSEDVIKSLKEIYVFIKDKYDIINTARKHVEYIYLLTQDPKTEDVGLTLYVIWISLKRAIENIETLDFEHLEKIIKQQTMTEMKKNRKKGALIL